MSDTDPPDEGGKQPQTLTRMHLADAVYREVGLSRNESAALVEAVLDEIRDALIAGDTVKISSFGSFNVREKGERLGRNPKTREEARIPPRRVLTFRPSNLLKRRVNAAHKGTETGDEEG